LTINVIISQELFSILWKKPDSLSWALHLVVAEAGRKRWKHHRITSERELGQSDLMDRI